MPGARHSQGTAAVADLEFVLYSSACGACRLTRERVDLVAGAVGRDRVTWREVDVVADPGNAEADGVDRTPTVVLRRSDGTEAMRAVGLPTIEQVLAAVSAHLTPATERARGEQRLA